MQTAVYKSLPIILTRESHTIQEVQMSANTCYYKVTKLTLDQRDFATGVITTVYSARQLGKQNLPNRISS